MEKNAIVVDEEKIGNIMKNNFINITKNLNLKPLDRNKVDIDMFENHISIKKVHETFPNIIPENFRFKEVSKGEDLSIIMQSRKTLFSEKVSWVKKERDEDFNVPMGCYGGAEICEIVGSYILNLLSNILDKGLVGLYRDDDLTIVRNLSGT